MVLLNLSTTLWREGSDLRSPKASDKICKRVKNYSRIPARTFEKEGEKIFQLLSDFSKNVKVYEDYRVATDIG